MGSIPVQATNIKDMEDKIYREVINPKTGKKVLEPLTELDILAIAREIKTKKLKIL